MFRKTRRNVVLLIFGLLAVVGIAHLLFEWSRYNLISSEEIGSVRQRLHQLSSQERQELSYFFHQLICFDQFPYTLVGDKPVSISHVLVEETEDLLPQFHNALQQVSHQKLRQGYLVWKKYESLFSKGKHHLLEYSFLGQGRKEIALIYPPACLSVIQKYLTDFQEILGHPYTSEDVFKVLTHTEDAHFYKLVDHTRLMGILLGYGRVNAHLYEKYRGGGSRSNMAWSQRVSGDPLQCFNHEWPIPGRVLSPSFACDPDLEETRQLRELYKQSHKTVYWTYFLRNHLEVTLALLGR